MAKPIVRNINMFGAKEALTPLAQSNYYQVSFSSLKPSVTNHLTFMGIGNVRDFISRKSGILCSEASLPASAFTTGEVKGDFMGVPQEFAHTRIYTDIDFTFYIDENYTNLRIFEGWMDYISSGANVSQGQKGFYRRVQYPDSYKCDTMYITKFEKNYRRRLDYQFINAFPKSITSIPVSYGTAEILKVTVSFNYDRYIMDVGSINN
mgnify:FL=1